MAVKDLVKDNLTFKESKVMNELVSLARISATYNEFNTKITVWQQGQEPKIQGLKCGSVLNGANVMREMMRVSTRLCKLVNDLGEDVQ